MTSLELATYQARFEHAVAEVERVARAHAEAGRETGPGGLHDQISAYCRAQFPPWKFIHARTDQRSTIEAGAPDFVIMAPDGRTFLIECKTKTSKLTTEQLGWALQARALGHTVHCVRSFQDFLVALKVSL